MFNFKGDKMDLSVIDLKESVIEYLEAKGIDYNERLVDMIAIELSEKLEEYECNNGKKLNIGETPYYSMLSQSVYMSLKRLKDVYFYNREYDVVEDDYSEQSDAEMHL
jgi:hypothetical protein